MAEPVNGDGDATPLVCRVDFGSFKALKAVRVPFRSRFTLVVGRNASGKSSVLDGLHFALQMLVPRDEDQGSENGRPGSVFSGPRSPARLVTQGSDSALKVVVGIGNGELGVRARPPGQGGERDRFRVYWRPDLGEHSLCEATWPGDDGGATAAKQLAKIANTEALRGAGAVARLRLDARAAVRPSVPGAREPRVEHDGAGLPSVLAWLAGNDTATRDAIQNALAAVVPGAGALRTPKEEVVTEHQELVRIGEDVLPRRTKRREWGDAFALEMFGAGFVPADLLSDGTVIVLALLTLLHAPSCPRIVLLDDVDAGLHPAAQVEVVAAIRRVLELKPGLQIIATAHSPYLLDEFEAQDVIVLRPDEQGHAHARPLSEHPGAESSRGLLRTGEFWSSVGDDWVFGDDSSDGQP